MPPYSFSLIFCSLFLCGCFFLLFFFSILPRPNGVPPRCVLTRRVTPAVVISPEIVMEVEKRMNRQHTPPSLCVPSSSTGAGGAVSMAIANNVSVAINAPQPRPIPKNTRERRKGLATLPEGLGFSIGGNRMATRIHIRSDLQTD